MQLIHKEGLAKKILAQAREDRKKEDTTHHINPLTGDDKLVSHISCETYETATSCRYSTYYFQNKPSEDLDRLASEPPSPSPDVQALHDYALRLKL